MLGLSLQDPADLLFELSLCMSIIKCICKKKKTVNEFVAAKYIILRAKHAARQPLINLTCERNRLLHLETKFV